MSRDAAVTASVQDRALRASVIVSVYKDVEALRAILVNLERQTVRDFEILVTEDGESPDIAGYLAAQRDTALPVVHLTQEDRGFRKMTAVNRAIAAARGDYLIFLDGDCLPNSRFVERHLAEARPDTVCRGRRVYFGPRASKLLRKHPKLLSIFENRLLYLLLAIPLHVDGVRSYEVGFPSRWLQYLARNRLQGIIGCNFSCYRADMLSINGYNEDLPGAGGEDGDLEWRLEGVGKQMKNVKFRAPVYHLYHQVRRQRAEENIAISERNRANREFVCRNGIFKYPA